MRNSIILREMKPRCPIRDKICSSPEGCYVHGCLVSLSEIRGKMREIENLQRGKLLGEVAK